MSRLDDAPQTGPSNRSDWRRWLLDHHSTSTGVWLVLARGGRGGARLSYEEAVEELLCFGWIDSTTRALDDEHTMIYVAPRKKGGTWAASNKARVERLDSAGLMTDAGRRVVEQAKADGSWTILDPIDALEVPEDLAAAFADHPAARERYDRLSPSAKKQVLWSVVSAKRPETRARRVAAVITRAEAGQPLT